MILIIKSYGIHKKVWHFILNIMTYPFMIYAKSADHALKRIYMYINEIRFSLKEIDRLTYDILSILRYFEETWSVAAWGISTNNIFYDNKSKKMKVSYL